MRRNSRGSTTLYSLTLSYEADKKAQRMKQEAPEVRGRSVVRTELNRAIFSLYRCSEDSIPNAQRRAEVGRHLRIGVVFRSRVMPVMKHRRNEQTSERSEC